MTVKAWKKWLASVSAAGIIGVGAFIVGNDDVTGYEFLTRTVDKTSPDVICLNDAHENEIEFKDDTFEAACPECGLTEWLSRTNDKVSKAGHFITYKPAGWSWGTNEIDHYIILRLEDCTAAGADSLCAGLIPADHLSDKMKRINSRYRKFKYDFENDLSAQELQDSKDKSKSREKRIIKRKLKEVSGE